MREWESLANYFLDRKVPIEDTLPNITLGLKLGQFNSINSTQFVNYEKLRVMKWSIDESMFYKLRAGSWLSVLQAEMMTHWLIEYWLMR